jgi:hypothetical protein
MVVLCQIFSVGEFLPRVENMEKSTKEDIATNFEANVSWNQKGILHANLRVAKGYKGSFK